MLNHSTPSFVPGSMLLVLPVPFRLEGNRLFIESQAHNGLNRWADNFERVVAAAPVMPESLAQADKTISWQPADNNLSDRVTCVPLPWAYGLKDFVQAYPKYRKVLADQVKSCEYLQFAIGGLVGDWAAVAAREARKQGRRYAIHTDRVEPELLRKLARSSRGVRRWKKLIEADLMDRYHRTLIRHCSVGLWHGQECFSAYSPWCSNNHLIHDVHTKPSDAISADRLEVKLKDAISARELRIVYAGRMSEMKAPLEWSKAIAAARDRGIALRATWYGDGELRSQMEAELATLQLSDTVKLTGFVSDRQILLEGLRDAHIMLFTHITPESPRCLLESLICGTPIIGYDNAFARDLTVNHGGGSFVPMHDWAALGARIASLAGQRGELASLIADAATNGRRFNDEHVFRERSLIVKSMAQ